MDADYNLRMFDLNGQPLDRFHATANVTWALNEYGIAEFEMPCTDPKVTRKNFELGRYVLFEHARLGKWAGAISSEEGMSGTWNNSIIFRARSAEWQFTRTRAPLFDIEDENPGAVTGTYGAILLKLIEYANARKDMLLRPGNIYMGDKTSMFKLQDCILRDILDLMVERRSWDWWCEPVIERGRLRFKVNLAVRRGVEIATILQERVNLVKSNGELWRRKGTLINNVVVTYSGNPIHSRGEAENEASINSYWLYQGRGSVDVDNKEQAQALADEIVKKQGESTTELFLTVTESRESPDTFQYIREGNIIPLRIDSAKFYGDRGGIAERVRILSREYNTKKNLCILVVEVI